MVKDIGRACAAAWPASLRRWSRPSGSGGRSPRFWLLRHLMPPGPETPCGFRGTRWSSRPGRSCRLHADGRRLTDRPLSLCRASRWWLTGEREEARSGSRKSRLVIGCVTVQKLLKWQIQMTQLFLLCSTITGWTNHTMLTQPEERTESIWRSSLTFEWNYRGDKKGFSHLIFLAVLFFFFYISSCCPQFGCWTLLIPPRANW